MSSKEYRTKRYAISYDSSGYVPKLYERTPATYSTNNNYSRDVIVEMARASFSGFYIVFRRIIPAEDTVSTYAYIPGTSTTSHRKAFRPSQHFISLAVRSPNRQTAVAWCLFFLGMYLPYEYQER